MRSKTSSPLVTGKDGLRGTIVAPPPGAPPDGTRLTLRVESGQEFEIPKHQLELQPDGTYHLPYSQSELEIRESMKDYIEDAAAKRLTRTSDRPAPPTRVVENPAPAQTAPAAEGNGSAAVGEAVSVAALPGDSGQRVIPVLEEEATVEKRKVETGKVRIEKVLREREEVVDTPLIREEVEIERVPVGKVVDAPPPMRVEGDTTIISLVEEEVVVQKRLVLKEELHVRLKRTEVHEPQTIQLLSEEAKVERENLIPDTKIQSKVNAHDEG